MLTILTALLLVSACTPDTPPTTPTAPVIESFSAFATKATAPATVTLGWRLQNPGGGTLTCEITSDDPGFGTLTVSPCRAQESRNVVADTVGTARTISYTLLVKNELGMTETRSASFTVAPGSGEPFDITLSGLDDLDPGVAAAVSSAAARWEQVIVAGLPDTSSYPSWCDDPDGYTMPASIDDLLVHVQVVPLDGTDGALAVAGPDCILLEGERALTGVVSIDSADVAGMLADGTLVDVLIHEMGHVLGLGTLWDTGDWGTRHLISGSGSGDPRLTGPAASAEWQRLGGSGDTPLENSGGSGTTEAHWRESIFGNEVMTGWIDPDAPLSRVSVAALADLGFNVDLDAADDYTLPGAALRRPGAGDRRQIERGDFAPPMRTPG